MRLDVKASAIAGAVICGVGLFLLTWWLILFGDAKAETTSLISQVYLGYRVDAIGSLIGLFWGAVDGLFGGFFFAWVYNRVVARMPEAKTEIKTEQFAEPTLA